MVDATALKYYKTTNGLGGAITGTELFNATPQNLFTNVPRTELIAGEEYYQCFFLKNTSSEDMDKFTIFLSNGTPLDYTALNWQFDPLANPYYGGVGFDGVNDYISVGNYADLWSKSLTKFSFSFWIWTWDTADGNDRVVISHGGTSNEGFRCIVSGSTANRIRFLIKDSGGVIHEAFIDTCTTGRWHHIICSYDNSLVTQNIRIYCDGVKASSANFTSAINLSADLTISESSNDHHGYIRDFRFWDDQAVNDSEALDFFAGHYTSETAFHLKFDERTGLAGDANSTRTVDVSANGAFWKTSAETIANIYSVPAQITSWYGSGDKPPVIGTLKAGTSFPIWCKLIVDPDIEAKSVVNDSGIFDIKFDISGSTGGTPSPGSGGSGGGNGGNPDPVADYKIAFVGDWGNTSDTTKVLDLIKAQKYDFVVGLGDNAYDDSSASSWKSKFNFLKDKMISCYGNHEYEDGSPSDYLGFFGQSKTYHSVRWQNWLFLVIDDNDDKGGVDLDAQKSWAQNEIAKYKNDSKVTWRAFVMHHPWFGNNAKHDENEFNQIQKFHKLGTDNKFSFIFCGHNHNWIRSHKCGYNSGNPKSPNIIDSSSPYTRNDNGLMMVGSGTGGHDHNGGYKLSDDAAFWAYRNNNHNGVFEFVASNNGNTLTGRYRDISGNTYSQFTITA